MIHAANDVIANRYEIVTFFNQGGMQEVYIAKDKTFGRRIALKVPKSDGAAKRFDRSARLSARVRHANVAATLDYVEHDGRTYLIEELVAGKDLRVRLREDFYYLDPHLAAHMVSHLARGLAAAHHAGVAHRDLKPSNIIVSDDGAMSVVKITDFGVAKLANDRLAEELEELNRDQSTLLTGSQTLIGAIPYMAPERFIKPADVDLKSDVWALGAILYHLMSGEPPFGSGAAAIGKILAGQGVSAPTMFGRFSAFSALESALMNVVSRCLVGDPKLRPSADELVELCADLCYSSSPRIEGTIDEYPAGNGSWGFIRSTDGKIFLHGSEFYGTNPKSGVRVGFAVHPGSPRPRAALAIPLRPI